MTKPHLVFTRGKPTATRPRASDPMTEALAWLRAAGLHPEQMTEFQVKIDEVNYYPGKGTIFIDGEPKARPDTGLKALHAVLCELEILG